MLQATRSVQAASQHTCPLLWHVPRIRSHLKRLHILNSSLAVAATRSAATCQHTFCCRMQNGLLHAPASADAFLAALSAAWSMYTQGCTGAAVQLPFPALRSGACFPLSKLWCVSDACLARS